jgi:hypothetical protein
MFNTKMMSAASPPLLSSSGSMDQSESISGAYVAPVDVARFTAVRSCRGPWLLADTGFDP